MACTREETVTTVPISIGMNRRTVVTTLGASVVTLAGCAGQDNPETVSTDTTTTPADDSPTATTTESPVGTRDPPYDLRLRNNGDSMTSMAVTVTYTESDNQIFSEKVFVRSAA